MPRLALVLGLLQLSMASLAAGELFALRIEQPQSGAIALIDDEIWFVPAPVKRESFDAIFNTSTTEAGTLQLFAKRPKPNLAIDAEAKEFRLTTREKPTADWKWFKVGARADTRICLLEVAEGKFKGLYLGLDQKIAPLERKKAQQPITVRKLRLVEKAEAALQFQVYPLAK